MRLKELANSILCPHVRESVMLYAVQKPSGAFFANAVNVGASVSL
jgi:hypothetical protein